MKVAYLLNQRYLNATRKWEKCLHPKQQKTGMKITEYSGTKQKLSTEKKTERAGIYLNRTDH